MLKKIKISNQILRKITDEAYSTSSVVLGKKIKNFDKKFFSLIKNKKNRSRVFECFNMLIALNFANYEIYNKIKKKIKKNLIIWTYPQVRLDGSFSNKFLSPLHKDEWVLDKNKKGYVVWFPINSDGGSLLISKNNKERKYKKDNYWGIKCTNEENLEEIKINYGEGLLFDKNILHKSKMNQNRITVQFRFEEINSNFLKKSVTQVIDNEVRKYWSSRLLNR